PAGPNGDQFVVSYRLPEAMGSGTLKARLKPDRILAQSLEITADDVAALQRVANQVATLRAEPNVDAAATGKLGENDSDGSGYSIVDAKGIWVRLQTANGGGWTSIDAFCDGVCRDLMNVGLFANDVLAVTA